MMSRYTIAIVPAIFFLTFLTAQGQHVIRCADPECPLCLSAPGAISPETSDTREPRHRPEDAPFGRPGTPAVVNPIFPSPNRSVISLRGDWEFAADPTAVGIAENWCSPEKEWPGRRTMPVPGNWESEGLGEPGMSTPWICYWDCIPRPLKNIYIGSAWYRKKIRIPDDWQNQRIDLKIGGVRAQGWFWVNGRPLAHFAQHCGTFKFDMSDLVQPGEEATIVALIRNDVPSRSGVVSACHTWGGIYRDIEIEASPAISLDNVECGGSVESKQADIRLTIGHRPEDEGKEVLVLVDLQPLDLDRPSQTTGMPQRERFRIALGPGTTTVAERQLQIGDFKAWSPEFPHLYRAEFQLLDTQNPEKIAHGWIERFGIKNLEVRGDRFYLNGKPYFLRGYGDDYIYPLTFISPIDREVHRKNLGIARKSGFAYVRHHTHCEIPEFYEAADELGIMIQSELPYYPYQGHHTTELFDFDPKRDIREVIDHYRRYVSHACYSMGNEGHLGTPIDNELKQMVKELDPSGLVLHNDGGNNTAENSDFLTGPITIWEPGSFVSELPFIAHEYMNLGHKFDPRISSRFTGAILPPRPLGPYEKQLQECGLDRRWGDACLDGGHALQRYYQKLGLESARLDPSCDGYSYWTIVDVIVKYGKTDLFTGQGMYNAFWEPKPGGATPEYIAKSNGPTALLMKPERNHPIFVPGETFGAAFWISHFGFEDFEKAALLWSIRDGEKILAEGKIGDLAVPTGEVREIGRIGWAVPETDRPLHLSLNVRLANTAVVNDWEFWVFPKREKPRLNGVAVVPGLYEQLQQRYDGLIPSDSPESAAAELVIARTTGEVFKNALPRGKKILLLGPAEGPPNVQLNWWWLGDQTGTAFAEHPAFGDFPHNGLIGPLWFRLIKKGKPIDPGREPAEKPDYLSVGEGREGYFLYAGEGVAENGCKVLLTHGLDLLAETPEGAHLLDQLIGYALSEKFRPQGTIALEGRAEEERLRGAIASGLNGWSKTISSPAQHSGTSYFVGAAKMRHMFFNADNEIVWETRPVEKTNDLSQNRSGTADQYTFDWLFGVGFVPNRPLKVRLIFEDRQLLDFSIDVSDRFWERKENGVTLKYRRMASMGTESTGVLSLSVPREMLAEGKTCTIRLQGKNLGYADSWVGILEK